jgi:hypothetical protein
MYVPRPIAGLAKLAIADNVDASFGWLRDDFVYRFLEAPFVRGLIVRLLIFNLLEEAHQFGRPH